MVSPFHYDLDFQQERTGHLLAELLIQLFQLFKDVSRQKNINDKAMKFEHGTTLNEQLINAIITTKNDTLIFEISDIINSFPPPVEGEVGPMGIRESGNKRKKR